MANSIKKKIVGNTFWMIGQRVYSMIVSLVIGSLSARFLGPSNYGVINYGASIISFFTVVSSLGLDSILVTEMIRNPQKKSSYIGSALIMRLVVSIISFAAICVIVYVLEPTNRIVQVVTIMQASVVILNTYEVLLYWFQMELNMKYVSIAAMISLTVTGGWRIWLLVMGKNVQYFAASSILSSVVTGIVIIYFFNRQARMKLVFSFNDAKFLLVNGAHFVISGLAIALYSQVDKIMLGKFIDTGSVGFYSAAATLVNFWEFVPVALINSVRPVLVKKMNDNYASYIKYYEILLLSISIMGGLVGIGVLIFGKTLVQILYGDEYMQAVPVMHILVWATSFAMIGTARTIWIVGENKNRYVKYYVFVGACLNIVLNVIFIPKWGIIAAAYTTLVSQIVVALVAPCLFNETRAFVGIYIHSFGRIRELIQLIKSFISSELRIVFQKKV